MTDSPVAAANARTMWKREIPATPAISSRVSSSARWLSINQSAFWAGFMDHGLHSKPAHYDRLPRAPFDSPCSRSPFRETGTGRMRPHLLPLFGKVRRLHRWQRAANARPGREVPPFAPPAFDAWALLMLD